MSLASGESDLAGLEVEAPYVESAESDLLGSNSSILRLAGMLWMRVLGMTLDTVWYTRLVAYIDDIHQQRR